MRAHPFFGTVAWCRLPGACSSLSSSPLTLPGVVMTFPVCLPRAPALQQVLVAMLAEGTLEWGLVELLRTSGGRIFCLIARLSPGLGLALAFWVVHVWVFSGSPSGSECSVLCFRHGCDVVLRDLPCSSIGGLHCTGPANARQITWEYVIACGGGQVSWSA